MKILMLVSLSCLLLSACSSVPSTNSGTNVEIFPVLSSISMRLDANSLEGSKTKLHEFIQENKQSLLTQRIELDWSGSNAGDFARLARSELLNSGSLPENIYENKNHHLLGERFNFRIQVTQYYVDDQTCAFPIVQSYDYSGGGCFTEHARWKSMVAPEKMLPSLQRVQE